MIYNYKKKLKKNNTCHIDVSKKGEKDCLLFFLLSYNKYNLNIKFITILIILSKEFKFDKVSKIFKKN